MAYNKTTWTDASPNETPQLYNITPDGEAELHGCTIVPHTAPTPGTELNASNLNNMEAGIDAALTIEGRQGGHADNWWTSGTTNYTPDKVRMQAGVRHGYIPDGYNSYTLSVTFPTPFAATPIITLGPGLYDLGAPDPYLVYITNVTASGFDLYFIPRDGGTFNNNSDVDIAWVALGLLP